MGLLDFPKKVYDFITKPEVQDEGGIVGNTVAGIKSMISGVVKHPLEKALCGVKTVKDDGLKAWENIKNSATSDPLELIKNVGKDIVLAANEGGNLASSGLGGTVEVAEELDRAICDAIDYTNSAVHRVTGLVKFIPVVGTTVSHAASIVLSPVTVATKVLRIPAKVSAKIRTTIGGPIGNFHKGVSDKFAISPSSSSASAAPASPEAPSDAEPAAA